MAIVVTNGVYYVRYTEHRGIRLTDDISKAYEFPTVKNAVYGLNRAPTRTEGFYVYDTETKTVMVNNLLITNKDMPQKKVYELTKALFENVEELEQTNSSAKKITLAKAAEQLPLSLHSGAKKYYKEKGIIK